MLALKACAVANKLCPTTPTKRMKWLRPCIGFDREEEGNYWDILPKLG
jgi:hypothetical protein